MTDSLSGIIDALDAAYQWQCPEDIGKAFEEIWGEYGDKIRRAIVRRHQDEEQNCSVWITNSAHNKSLSYQRSEIIEAQRSKMTILIEKLKSEHAKYVDSDYANGLAYAITIVRQHQAELPYCRKSHESEIGEEVIVICEQPADMVKWVASAIASAWGQNVDESHRIDAKAAIAAMGEESIRKDEQRVKPDCLADGICPSPASASYSEKPLQPDKLAKSEYSYIGHDLPESPLPHPANLREHPTSPASGPREDCPWKCMPDAPHCLCAKGSGYSDNAGVKGSDPRNVRMSVAPAPNSSEISDNVSQYNKALLHIEAAMKQQLDLCGYYKSQPNPRLLAYAAVDTMATGGEGQLINRDEAIKQIGSLLRAETTGLENLQNMYNAGVKDSANRVAAVLPHLRSPEPVSVSLKKCTEAILGADMADSVWERVGEFDAKNYAKAVLDAAGVKYVD